MPYTVVRDHSKLGDAFIRVTVHPETFALDNILAGPYTWKSEAEREAYRFEFWEEFEEATGAVSFDCGIRPDANSLMEKWLAITKADLHWAGQQAYGAAIAESNHVNKCFLNAIGLQAQYDCF